MTMQYHGHVYILIIRLVFTARSILIKHVVHLSHSNTHLSRLHADKLLFHYRNSDGNIIGLAAREDHVKSLRGTERVRRFHVLRTADERVKSGEDIDYKIFTSNKVVQTSMTAKG